MEEKSMERFWNKVERTEGCWLWKGSCRNGEGYGQLSIKRKTYYSHRIAYELVKGPIPEGYVIDHICRNPRCVNPSHLEAVEQKVNVQRGNTTKFSESDILEIRRLFNEEGMRPGEIAKLYSVGRVCIQLIVRNKRWINVRKED